MVFQQIDPNAKFGEKLATSVLSRPADEILTPNDKEDVNQAQTQKVSEENADVLGAVNISNICIGDFRVVDLKKSQPFQTTKICPADDDNSLNGLESKVCLNILSQDLLLDNMDWDVLSNKFSLPPPVVNLNLDAKPSSQHALSYCCSDDETEENTPVFSSYSPFESPEYMYESAFPRLPEEISQYEDDERFELVGAIWNNQYDPETSAQDSIPFCPSAIENVNIAAEIKPDMEKKVSSASSEMLMPGIPVMIQGGDFSGNFGLVENSYDEHCEVNVFVRESCENQLFNVEKHFLAPIVPDQDLKLAVTFEEEAEIYFCPRDAVKCEESSEFKWIGMKAWCVMNPILNLAIPEGSSLEKINDVALEHDLEFAKIQEQLDDLQTPYTMTFQFPSGVQQIKLDELYTCEQSAVDSESQSILSAVDSEESAAKSSDN